MFNKKVSAPTTAIMKAVDNLIIDGVDEYLGGKLYGLNKDHDITAKDLVLIDTDIDLQDMLATYHCEHGKKYKFLALMCVGEAVHQMDESKNQKVRTVFLSNKAGTKACARFEHDFMTQKVMLGSQINDDFSETLEKALR